MSVSSKDWREVTDKKSGRIYYYNKATKEVQWRPPEGFLDEDKDNRSKDNWVATVDAATGVTIYFNKVTMETRNAKPSVFSRDEEVPLSKQASQVPASPIEEDLGDPRLWRRAIDPQTGRAYYYNIETRKTTNRKPMGFDEAINNTPLRSRKKLMGPQEVKPIEEMESKLDVPVTKNQREIETLKRKKKKDGHARMDSIWSDESSNNDEVKEPSVSLDKKSEISQEESIDPMNFSLMKQRSWTYKLRLHIPKAKTERDVLSFQSTNIKKALLEPNRIYDPECIQNFKNIVSYMGDRKSGKTDEYHAKKLTQNGISAPQSVRDEMLLMVCKQIKDNPKEQSQEKGWQLFALLVAFFSPGPIMKSYIDEYVEPALKDDNVSKWAYVVLGRIDKGLLLSSRTYPATTEEITSEQIGEPLTVIVHTVDSNTYKVPVSWSMSIGELKLAMANRLGLFFLPPFTLVELRDNSKERLLEDKTRVLDVMSYWDKEKNDNKSTMVRFQLYLKAVLVLRLTDSSELRTDDIAISLLFFQAVHDIVNEWYTGETNNIDSIAALQIQAIYGDYIPETRGIDWIKSIAQSILPAALTKTEGLISEHAQKIMTKYQALQGILSSQAKLSYLEYVQEWLLYGAKLYPAEQYNFKDYPVDILLAVNTDGVRLVDPRGKQVVDDYGYIDIMTFGYGSDRLILTIGNILEHKKLQFIMKNGKEVCTLIQQYVNFKYKVEII